MSAFHACAGIVDGLHVATVEVIDIQGFNVASSSTSPKPPMPDDLMRALAT